MTSGPWTIYARQLFPLSYGHPLWGPEPCLTFGEVQLGDVGFLKDGHFSLLFNAIQNADHPVNSLRGVPEGFRVLDVPEHMIKRRPNEITQPLLHSKSLQAVSIAAGASISASSAGASSASSYSCMSEEGALLMLKKPAHRTYMNCDLRIRRYIRDHISSWCTFANEKLEIGLEEKDIIFVSGYMKTSVWAEAAFNHSSSSGELVIAGGVPSASGEFRVSMSRGVDASVFSRTGPLDRASMWEKDPGTALLESYNSDQCIFLNYYKMKSRAWWRSTVMRAAAGDHVFPYDGNDDSTFGVDLCGCSDERDEVEKSYDPVDGLLNYILKHSQAEAACVSDADLSHLFKGAALPKDLRGSLEALSPCIVLDDATVGTIVFPPLSPPLPPTMMKRDLGLLRRDETSSDVPMEGVVMPTNANEASNNGIALFFNGLQEMKLPIASIPEVPTNTDRLGLPTSESRAALIKHYLRSVLLIQYPTADPSIKDFMSRTIQNSQAARDAACLLSILHIHSTTRSPVNFNAVNSIYRQLHANLLTGRRLYTEADAVAGLHVVSSFLFSGGRGEWEMWLDIASQYTLTILNDRNVSGPEAALRRCSESTRFIIKTTIWFDVLASVTTQEVPRFLEHCRVLSDGACIDDPVGGSGVAPGISMLPAVGCENKIVLAIAEVSNLAHWKEGCPGRGTLSIPELRRRGALIAEQLLGTGSPYTALSPLRPEIDNSQTLQSHQVRWTKGIRRKEGGRSGDVAEVTERQRLTNNIFRTSAKVYLLAVLSEDNHLGPEITCAVAEAIEALRAVLGQPSWHRSFVGSVAFGACLSGCHTDDPAQRAMLLNMLNMLEIQEEPSGSIKEVARLIRQVWQRRDGNREQGRSMSVDWRAIMREGHNDSLLLV